MASGPCHPGDNIEPTERRVSVGAVTTSTSTPGAATHYMQAISPELKMTPERFVYWLQGFMELSGTQALTERHVRIINDHLAKVFNKQTPTYTDTVPAGPSLINPGVFKPPAPLGGDFIC